MGRRHPRRAGGDPVTLHPSHFLDELRRHPAGVVLITGNNRMPRPGAVPYRCDQLADALEALALLAASASADLFEQCERVAEQPRNVIDRPQDTVPASHGAAPQRPVPASPGSTRARPARRPRRASRPG
jgi:hypothetical protein